MEKFIKQQVNRANTYAFKIKEGLGYFLNKEVFLTCQFTTM